MKTTRLVTRRDFLSRAAGAGVGTAVLATGAWAATSPGENSKVVLVRHASVCRADDSLDVEILGRMLDDAVSTFFGVDDPAAAWKRVVTSRDTVGIKSNVAGPPRTPIELENLLRERVLAAGVSENKVSVDDRGVLRNPVFQEATALINVRPMRSHHWSGVGSLLKNYIMFSDNPPSWHDDSCANLAGLWQMPIVRDKTRLNILVMLTPLFHSKGPHNYNKAFVWNYGGLLIGTDPVAVDATGLRIIEAKRQAFFGEHQPLPVSPKHIQIAQTKYGLGVADPERIEVIKLGWEEDVLI